MATTSKMKMGTRSLFSPRPAGPSTVSGLPAGPGAVGTAANPSPQAPGVTTGMKRSPPTPNSGGIIDAGARGRRVLPTDPNYKGPLATGNTGPGPGNPGAWRGGAADRPAMAPTVDPGQEMTNRPAQTERANPLANGGGSPQLEGSSLPVNPPTLNPGKAMGFSQRGNKTPAGDDLNVFQPGDPNASGGQLAPQEGDVSNSRDLGVQGDLGAAREGIQSDLNPGQHAGGVGQYRRLFSNPTSASIYHDWTQKAFGGAATPKSKVSGLTRAPAKRDTGENDFGDYGQAA